MNPEIRAIFDPAPDMVLISEVGADGKVTIRYANPAFIRVSGFSHDELVGTSPTLVRGPRTDSTVYAALQSSRRAGEPVAGETLFYRKDHVALRVRFQGHGFVDASGRRLWMTISRDVTDHERDLSGRVASLEALINVAQTFLDRPQRAAADAIFRRALATIAQYSAGITIDEHATGDDDAFVRRVSEAPPFVRQSENGRSAFAFTRPGAPTSIVELHVEARVVDQRDLVTVDLLLQLYRTVLRGIAVYEELEQRRVESSRANQEKADLLAMLAHDVRTPLTTIIGYTELIAEENDAEVTAIGLRSIAIAARAISEIADEAMMSAQLDQNVFRPMVERIDLVPICELTVATYGERKPIVFSKNCDVLEIDVNPQSARAIVTNLIDNAVKYARGAAPIAVELEGDLDAITLTVRDDGIGIPADQLDFVFRPFSRARNASASHIGGTGFGLHLVKRLVELHGGHVFVESEVDVGSTFVVRIPRVAAILPRAKRLIVIDPTEERGSFVVSMMRGRGFAVSTVGDFRNAIDAHRNEPADLIIYDDDGRSEPASAGLAMLDVPYLILSARAEPLLLSSSHILAKPFLVDELYAAVASALEPA